MACTRHPDGVRRRSSTLPRTACALVVALAAALLSASSASASWTPLCSSAGIGCISSTGYAGASVWGYPVDVHGNNCTNYAAFRLRGNGVGDPGNLGNAGDWAHNARTKGFAVDGNPAVGAIAQWNYGSAYAPRYGHVAYVEEVGPGYIVETESNWDGPSRRVKITVGDRYWPSSFIHFRDVGSSTPPALPPPPPAAPSFLPPGAVNRFASASDHWVANGVAPSGYGFEATLGFAATRAGPGRHALYSCIIGGDQFVSPDPRCEGQRVLGLIGFAYDGPPDEPGGGVAIYRCTVSANGDHFVSPSPDCEGQHTEGMLGYLARVQSALNRYTNARGGGDHIVTAGAVPASSALEQTLGFMLDHAGAGRHPLYSCAVGSDQFLSPDATCEHQQVVGLEGWAYDNPPAVWPKVTPIYRCTVSANGEHFVSRDPRCEGQHTEGLLGYIPLTHPAFERFASASDHFVTAAAVPGGYSFESTLGYILQSPAAGRHPLYSCMAGSDQFVSPAADCEHQRVIGLDGWAYDEPAAGRVAIYRCTVNSNGEHFVSPDPSCEGQHAESLLGYLADSEAGAYAQPPGHAGQQPSGPGGSAGQPAGSRHHSSARCSRRRCHRHAHRHRRRHRRHHRR